MAERAEIFFKDRLAGFLTKTDEGYEFRYDENYLSSMDAVAVSLFATLLDA